MDAKISIPTMGNYEVCNKGRMLNMTELEEHVMEQEELKTELERMARKQLKKRKLTKICAIVLALIIVALGALLVGRSQIKKKTDKEEPTVVNPVAPEISLDVINLEIQNIAELATVEYLFTDAARFSDSKEIKGWSIPLTEKSFLMKWDGVIKAGINVNDIGIDIDDEKMIITLTMPEATILSYDVDESSVEVLDEKDNIFNNITVEDKVGFDEATENAMKERAIENGLLDQALSQAKITIEGLLTANPVIAENYEIVFR
jgi:hypothetical protein